MIQQHKKNLITKIKLYNTGNNNSIVYKYGSDL